MQALKRAGILAKHCQERWLTFDGDDMSIYINQARDGYPLFGIELNQQEVNNMDDNTLLENALIIQDSLNDTFIKIMSECNSNHLINV